MTPWFLFWPLGSAALVFAGVHQWFRWYAHRRSPYFASASALVCGGLLGVVMSLPMPSAGPPEATQLTGAMGALYWLTLFLVRRLPGVKP